MCAECEGFVSKKRRTKRFIFTPKTWQGGEHRVTYLERMINPLVLLDAFAHANDLDKPFESVDLIAIVTYLLFTEIVFDEREAVGAMKNQ